MSQFGILRSICELVSFACGATWARILTVDKLKRRGLEDSLLGATCVRKKKQTNDHILIHRSKA